jgi:hypothetical protein
MTPVALVGTLLVLRRGRVMRVLRRGPLLLVLRRGPLLLVLRRGPRAAGVRAGPGPVAVRSPPLLVALPIRAMLVTAGSWRGEHRAENDHHSGRDAVPTSTDQRTRTRRSPPL